MLHENLRSAAEHVIAVANAHGVGPELPSIPYEAAWMEPVSDGGWALRQSDHSEPAFFVVWKQLKEKLNDSPAFKSLIRVASEFAEREGKFLPVFGALLIDNAGELLVLSYFDRAAALRVDEPILEAVCNEFEADLRSDTVALNAIYRVRGLKAEKPFLLASGVNFRPMNLDDLAFYGRTSFDPFGIAPKSFGHQLFRDDWVCEIERRINKNSMDEFNDFGEEIEDIAASFNLTISGRVLFSLLEKQVKSPFLRIGTFRGGTEVATSRIGEPVVLDQHDLGRLQTKFARVTQIGSDDRLAHLRLPLRRLRMSASRTHDEDHVVDCVIALENLLASDSPQLETTFRFRLRGAAMLPVRFGTVQERIKLMGRLYEFRSKTVHAAKSAHGGGKKMHSTADETRRTAGEAETVLRGILAWFVERSEKPEKLAHTLAELDEAMVQGGQTWAQ
jgi:hypothetical protein